jgi:hypothetical protein
LGQIFHKNPFIWTFLQVHPHLAVLAQQIMDFLIVYFDETAANEVSLGSIILCDGDNLAKGAGNDSTHLLTVWNAHHCEGFAAAGLPVSEDGAIVAI